MWWIYLIVGVGAFVIGLLMGIGAGTKYQIKQFNDMIREQKKRKYLEQEEKGA